MPSTEQDDSRTNDDAAPTEEGGGIRRIIREWLPVVAIPILVAFLLHTFVIEAFIVPTGSMLDTIQLDDCVWCEKVSYYFKKPEAGDIVMFQQPTNKDVTLLKRVVATAGQTVDLVDGHVVVDGQTVEEPYVEGKPTYALDHYAPGVEPISYPYVIPEGHLWLMGDNRTNSLDSRYYGAIPENSVIGRAFCTYWPLDHARLL